MRARLLLPFLIAAFCNSAMAQMIGTNTFLQGRWLEIGMQNNGAFGAQTPPATYHPFAPGTGWLAETYDLGHDGWTVGVPPFNGDYTYPGSPFEGWMIQVNGQRNICHQGSGITGPGSLTGSSTSYSNTGGRAIGNWTGTASGGNLQVLQETRVDTTASWVVVTTRFKNTGATPIPGIYYIRHSDPDNDQAHGGGFNTNNTIVHQNEDARHMVQVDATGLTYNDHLGLTTKDCRAKGFIYYWWPFAATLDLADVYAGTAAFGGGSQYLLGGQLNGDYAIGLIYNIGTLAANDSAIISYAYYFNGLSGCDSAFPDPQIVVNGIPKPSWAPPTPNYDTLDVCNTGILSVPVDILNADDKCWSWSTWTWAPATGLASTTGVHNTINTGVLPPVITYTITGTDSASGMSSCNNKVFYLTIHTCNGATSNNPCLGDTIFFNAPGDSTDASYAWHGPNAFGTTPISTTQKWEKKPALMSDTGWYYVIKTVAGIPDTSKTHVTVHPLPTPTVISNQVNCGTMVPILTLNATTTEPMGTWAWTGPNGFTSTSSTPVISPFDSSGAGTYSVNVVSTFGCKSSGIVNVRPGAVANFLYSVAPGCGGDTVTLTNTSSNANQFTWTFDDGSAPVIMTTKNPPIKHVFTTHGHHNVTLTAANLYCSDPESKDINTTHSVTAAFSLTDPICLTLFTPTGPGVDPLTLVNSSTAIDETGHSGGTPPQGVVVRSTWNFGDGSAEETVSGTNVPTPGHIYTTSGTYIVTLTVVDSIGCESTDTATIHVLEPTLHGVTDTTFCLTAPAPLTHWVTIYPAIDTTEFGAYYQYAWSGTGTENLDNDSLRSPNFFGSAGDYTLTLTAILEPYKCMATHQTVVHSRLPMQIMGITLGSTIPLGESVQLNASGVLYYSWSPSDGSLNDPNINNPVATPTVTTTYTVYGFDIYGCRDTASVTIHVDSTMTEFTPSAFSPNGDNLNDMFRAKLGKHQKLVEFRIFNRWGEQLFVSSDIEAGWDGKYHGVPQDVGTYFYQIIAARPGYQDNVVYKGEITLIR